MTKALKGETYRVVNLISFKFRDRMFDILGYLNVITINVIDITVQCAFVEPWEAVLMCSTCVYVIILVSTFLLRVYILYQLEFSLFYRAACAQL